MTGVAERKVCGRTETGQKLPRAAAPGHDILEGTDVLMGQRRDDVSQGRGSLT